MVWYAIPLVVVVYFCFVFFAEKEDRAFVFGAGVMFTVLALFVAFGLAIVMGRFIYNPLPIETVVTQTPLVALKDDAYIQGDARLVFLFGYANLGQGACYEFLERTPDGAMKRGTVNTYSVFIREEDREDAVKKVITKWRPSKLKMWGFTPKSMLPKTRTEFLVPKGTVTHIIEIDLE